MRIINTDLPDVVIVEPAVHRDHRGYFAEVWNDRRYAAAGLEAEFVQDNISFSGRGTLRGLHYQNLHPQGKLVYVLVGEIFDVALDIRNGSDTFGQWTGVWISADNHRQLFVPPGFAHGFCVTSPEAMVAYKCSQHYRPEAQGSIRWDDPDLGIRWPLTRPLLSAKDRDAPLLKDVSGDQLEFANTLVPEPRQLQAT